MKNLIRAFSTARLAQDGATELPDSIEWMPAGTHDIQCSRGGKPARVKVIINEAQVGVLNTQLQEARTLAEQGKASRPYIEIRHGQDEAAAIPTEFFWENGIRLRVEWTTAGAAAVSGRVYSYFSPEFFADAAGEVTGIPEVGPIGALVNTPAFQAIERIAASLTTQSMIAIAKALGLPETATEAEILANIAELAGSTTETAVELEAAKAALAVESAKVADAEAKVLAARTAAVTAEVERHAITAGIPEAARPMLVAGILANETEGRKVLAAFKPQKPTAGVAPFKAAQEGDGKPQTDGEILAAFNAMPNGKDKDLYQRANGSALLRASRAK